MHADHDLGQVKINCVRNILDNKLEGAHDMQTLPPGWEAKATPEGRIIFINHDLQISQWNHPVMDELDLPEGWEKHPDGHGRMMYVDTESGKPGSTALVQSVLLL